MLYIWHIIKYIHTCMYNIKHIIHYSTYIFPHPIYIVKIPTLYNPTCKQQHILMLLYVTEKVLYNILYNIFASLFHCHWHSAVCIFVLSSYFLDKIHFLYYGFLMVIVWHFIYCNVLLYNLKRQIYVYAYIYDKSI